MKRFLAVVADDLFSINMHEECLLTLEMKADREATAMARERKGANVTVDYYERIEGAWTPIKSSTTMISAA